MCSLSHAVIKVMRWCRGVRGHCSRAWEQYGFIFTQLLIRPHWAAGVITYAQFSVVGGLCKNLSIKFYIETTTGASIIKTNNHFHKRYFRLTNVEGVSGQGDVPVQMSYNHTGANVCRRCVGVPSCIT